MEKARPFIVLTVVIALLVGALAIADTVARGQAENHVASRVAEQFGMTSKPDVSLHGWPFLVHALTRSLPRAEITADELTTTIGGHQVTISGFRVVATNIEPDGDGYLLKRVEAQGTVGYEALSKYAGSSTVSARDGGRIAISYSTDVLGQRMQAVVTGVPQLDVDRQEVNLRDPRVEVAGMELTDDLARLLIEAVAKPVSVRVPNATVRSIEAGPDGVHVTADADNFTVSGI